MAERPKATLKVIVARIIVGVLFSMLILSFAIWGIGDIFRRGLRTQYVAEVGSLRITPQAFQEQYRRELRRLQTMLQTQIDPQRARELGVPQRVVEDMVARLLFQLAARDAGIVVSDEVVRQAITENPAFRSPDGKFDRRIFEGLLYNAGYTEDAFVASMREDLTRQQLIDAITSGAAVPASLVEDLYRYRNERRVAETLVVDAAKIKDVPTPTDAELEAYHKAHAEEFTAPEYRTITAVEIRPADLAAEIKVPDDKIKDEYEARAADFKVPEERALRQILLPDEATAKRAEEMLAKGDAFDKVAQEVTGKPPQDIGTIKESEVGSEDLGKAAFEVKEGGVTAPIESPLGWHIVDVVKVTPGRAQSFDEVKDKLAKDLALREANDAVFDLGNKLQDAFGGGASLEEAAQKLALKVIKLDSVDAKGNGPDGKPAANLPKSAKFLATAFAAETGHESDLIEDGQGGYLVLRVDKVVPSALRPLAEVRDKVLAGWQAEARRKQAEKIAATLVEKAKGGSGLADLAKQGGYADAITKPFTRSGEGADQPLPPELVAALFAAKPGDVVSAPSRDGAVVAKLTEIKPAGPKSDAAGIERLRQQLLGSIDSDLLDSFGETLRRHYGVEINQEAVNSLVGS